MQSHLPTVLATQDSAAELDQLGDEIAELSAHLDAATARRGLLLPEVPPSVVVLGDPVEVLRAGHDALGLRLDARTACADWLGERLDLGWAIDAMHPLARRPKP